MFFFETAQQLFHACENPLGWVGCKPYVTKVAAFVTQSEPLGQALAWDGGR